LPTEKRANKAVNAINEDKDKMKTYWIIFIFLPILSWSQDIIIGPGGDFATLSEANASISAGDSIMVLDGVYEDGSQFLRDLKGTELNPITIYSETRHGAIFRGGAEGIHLINAEHVVLDGFVSEGQTGNGFNIDDGSDYSTPTKHIEIKNCLFRDITPSGNHDFLKLSGLDSFHIHDCTFENGGTGGSGIDMVGCHHGIIEDNIIDDAGATGIQTKGGTQYITIRRNILRDMSQRALNLGGSTGFAFFRPPIQRPFQDLFEAADLLVYSNVFIRSWAPIAYVGCVRVKVINNTIIDPENWVIRILQETTEPGFLTCANNSFINNIVYVREDLREVNIGPDTDPGSFHFSHNNWFNESDNTWLPQLPVTDTFQTDDDPLFVDLTGGDYHLMRMSPCIGQGRKVDFVSKDFDQEDFLSPPSQGGFEGGEMTTSLKGSYEELGYSIMPNPITDHFVLESNLRDISFVLSDVNGSRILISKKDGRSFRIEMDGLESGVYLLSVVAKDERFCSSFKLVKN